MSNEKMGFIDYVFLALFLAMLFMAVSCTKDPDCHTTHIGTVDKEIGGGKIEKTFIFETSCL